MKCMFKHFKAGGFTSWESMCEEVASFISTVGKDRIIGVSQSEDHNHAVIVVWYWSR